MVHLPAIRSHLDEHPCRRNHRDIKILAGRKPVSGREPSMSMSQSRPCGVKQREGNTGGSAIGERPPDPARSENRCMRGNTKRGTRVIPQVPTGLVLGSRPGKAIARLPGMYAGGESDNCVVRGKLPNMGSFRVHAEAVDGRRSIKGNSMSEAVSRTRAKSTCRSRHRVRRVASSHRHHPR